MIVDRGRGDMLEKMHIRPTICEENKSQLLTHVDHVSRGLRNSGLLANNLSEHLSINRPRCNRFSPISWLEAK